MFVLTLIIHFNNSIYLIFECLLIQNLVKIIYKKCSVFIKILCAGCVPPKKIRMFSVVKEQFKTEKKHLVKKKSF
jgi:hypothetical protein